MRHKMRKPFLIALNIWQSPIAQLFKGIRASLRAHWKPTAAAKICILNCCCLGHWVLVLLPQMSKTTYDSTPRWPLHMINIARWKQDSKLLVLGYFLKILVLGFEDWGPIFPNYQNTLYSQS